MKNEADKQPSNLLKAILQLDDKIRPKSKPAKDKKQIILKV